MKTLSTKEAAQAIRDGKTLVIESHPNESGGTVTIQMSAKDFEEGEDLPEVVYYDRHCSNLEGKLVGLEPSGHIRLYNDGYVVVEPSYLHPMEFLNVYYHLLAKLSYEESYGDIRVT